MVDRNDFIDLDRSEPIEGGSLREYLRILAARGGRKGGKAKGKCKRRGERDYYKRLSQLGAMARRKAKQRFNEGS